MGCIERQSEFRGENDAVAERSQSLAQQLFVIVRTVGCAIHLGRIEKGITHFYGIGQKFRHFVFVSRRTVGMAHAHAAQPDRGNAQAA